MSGGQTLEHGNPEKRSMLSGCLWFAGSPPDTPGVERLLAQGGVAIEQKEVARASLSLRVTCGSVEIAIGVVGAPGLAMVPSNFFGLEREMIKSASVVTVTPVSSGVNDAGPVETVRAVATVLLRLCAIDGCVAVGWSPAESAMARDYFRSVVGKWLEGGPFPALGLIALKAHGNGGLISVGLAAICGQELVVAPGSGLPTVEAARVAVRVIDDVVSNGPVNVASTVEIDGFGLFEIGPDENRKNIYLRKTPDR